ncbi:MAG: hypothetical protein WDO13_19750 [Verrucomicrobiota bacterium]
MAYKYENKQTALLAKVKGKTGKISDKTHEEHLKLYTGYVNKSNAILEELEKLGTPDPSDAKVANQIQSVIRNWKVDLTFALGGLKNHELYFGILGGDGKPTGKFADLVDRDFGSFDNYKKDLKAPALPLAAGPGPVSITIPASSSTTSATRRTPTRSGESRRCSASTSTSTPTTPTSSRPAPPTSMNFCSSSTTPRSTRCCRSRKL